MSSRPFRRQLKVNWQQIMNAMRAVFFGIYSILCVIMLPCALLGESIEDVKLYDFVLAGQADEAGMSFRLTTMAEVKPKGGASILLCKGKIALVELQEKRSYRIERSGENYVLIFEKAGKYPVELEFRAKVEEDDDLRSVELWLASTPLRRLNVVGLPDEVKLEVSFATRPTLSQGSYSCVLSANPELSMRWKVASEESSGKLFYASSSIAELSVSPGLLRQSHLLRAEVLQGDLDSLEFRLVGEGEVVRVDGKDLLSWQVEAIPDGVDRRLVVRLSQPQQGEYLLRVNARQALGSFPLEVEPLRISPSRAIRHNGYLRLANDGAVHLEILETTGLSRVSPELFPQAGELSDSRPAGERSFAFRHSGENFVLRAMAGDVLPVVGVSQMLLYHLGENDLSIRAELELDVREAPLREFSLLIPAGFSPAGLQVSDLADYFITPVDEKNARLRLVFSKPVLGRAVAKLELESNAGVAQGPWSPPRIVPEKVKSLRGQVGVSVSPGVRVKVADFGGLVEMATAFFPKKEEDLQLAFRIKGEDWNLELTHERIERSLRVDALQVFSIGEGVAYGSSVFHYFITGAPVTELEVATPSGYANVEFIGKDVRSWEKTPAGHRCRLHSPQSGAFTLLVTYDLRFEPSGGLLSLAGARPVDAKVEHGYVIAASHHYTREKGAEGEILSPHLLELEPTEVPADFRLLYDAPLVSAFRYSGRPLEVNLMLRPFDHVESVRQVADYTTLLTRVSAKGEILTDARYLVKSKGMAHFRVELPEGADLWSVRVNDRKVTPVAKGTETLVPLPQSSDPNQIATVEIKLAEKTKDAESFLLRAPAVKSASSLLAKWRVEPERGRILVDLSGNAEKEEAGLAPGGFAWLSSLLLGEFGIKPLLCIVLAPLCVVVGSWAVRRARATDCRRGELRTLLLGVFAAFSFSLGLLLLLPVTKVGFEHNPELIPDPGLTYILPPRDDGAFPSFAIENISVEDSGDEIAAAAWFPASGALLLAGWMLMFKLRGDRVRLFALKTSLVWTGVFWTCLVSHVPAGSFCSVLGTCLVFHGILPAALLFLSLPRISPQPEGKKEERGTGSAVTACLAFVFFFFASNEADAVPQPVKVPEPTSELETPKGKEAPITSVPVSTQSVVYSISVEKDRAKVKSVVEWIPKANESLALLHGPAVLTSLQVVPDGPKLVQLLADDGRVSYVLSPKKSSSFRSGRGRFSLFGRNSRFSLSRKSHSSATIPQKGYRINYSFESVVGRQDGFATLALPKLAGFINAVDLRVDRPDLLVESPQAVTVIVDRSEGNATSARLHLAPSDSPILRWQPRSRDLRSEEALLYAEFAHLFLPAAGIVEGVHEARIRPARGRAAELEFITPPNLTITDVKHIEGLESWRFDPDASMLRVRFDPPMSEPFDLLIRSQLSAAPFPYERVVGPLSLKGAAGQVGMVAVATGNEAQVDTSVVEGMANVNLEDFPFNRLAGFADVSGFPSPRRAYRYAQPSAKLSLGIVAVEPDVRVTSRETLSLSEDRTLLAVDLQVSVTRAGIFQLSFPLPEDLEVETLSGEALSHWDETKDANGTRLVTLHLREKLMGRHDLKVVLVGSSTQFGENWPVPRLILREAAKHAGVLLVYPERGLRVEVAERRGLSSVDPKKFGITEKGVSTFRFLRSDHFLSLDLVKVDSWVSATLLQDVTARKGLLETRARISYLIENAGVRSLTIRLPEGATGERIRGEHIEDFVKVPAADGNGTVPNMREVRLRKRIIGPYELDVSYHLPVPEGDEDATGLRRSKATVFGLDLPEVHSLRAFLSLRAGGRLQVETIPSSIPSVLRPIEWLSIPEDLRRKTGAADANLAFRALRPEYELPIVITGLPADETLPARVRAFELVSTFSESGLLLTEATVRLDAGDKERLTVLLPTGARFWSAFVNGQAVAVRRESAKILVPLEENVLRDGPTEVRFLYALKLAVDNLDDIDVLLRGPRLDLPLENITWRLRLPEDWETEEFVDGTLERREDNATLGDAFAFDLEAYLAGESHLREMGEKRAEALLEAGNDLIAGGRRLRAREALRSAWRLSRSDKSFNEDARVQLRNLKLNDALVCLANRRAKHLEENDENRSPVVLELDASGDNPVFTNDQARSLLSAATEENRQALRTIAAAIVDHQDAALAAPAAIRPNLPERGNVFLFERPLRVETFADLRLRLQASRKVQSASFGPPFLLLVVLFLATAALVAALRFRERP